MQVPDAFLLEVAGIAASLLGFFIVGVFFFVQRGLFPEAADEAQGYMRAATASIMVLYGMTLLLSLALVVLSRAWVSVLYVMFTLVLVWSAGQTGRAIRRLHRAINLRLMSPLTMWAAMAVMAATPWLLGGVAPARPDFTVAIGFAGAFAFAGSASLVLFAFDISGVEEATRRNVERSSEMRDEHTGVTLEERFDRFGGRLRSILGTGRIRRSDKRARAEEAVEATEELVSAIVADLDAEQERYPR